jgi:hypothetical protein
VSATLDLREQARAPEIGPQLPAASAVRYPWGPVLAAVAVSVALRARFIVTPLTSDEGGYLTVARAWAQGRRLYDQTWVDRPQGLIVLFRAWDDISDGSGPAIRVMAALFGCLAVIAVGYVAFALANRRAAAAAAMFVAVASANARIEGFLANGELLAGATGVAGVACACGYLFRGHGLRWLFAAGVLGGVAISLKQSGCDGALAVIVILLAGVLTRERHWRAMLRELATYIGGLVTVIAVLVVHGAIIGFRNWWYAVAGYRTQGINATSSGADWPRFHETARIAAPTVYPLAAAAMGGIVVWLLFSRRLDRRTLLIPAWLCFAVLTFLAGGLFHRHYWVTLTFPLATAAGVALSRIRLRAALATSVALLALPSIISTLQVVTMPKAQATLTASGDPRPITDEAIGAWFRRSAAPGQSIMVLCASAALYADARTIPPYKYLWQDGMLHGKNGQALLLQLFTGPRAPTYVVEYQRVADCDPSGQLAKLLRLRYSQLTVVAGRPILTLRSGAPDLSAS